MPAFLELNILSGVPYVLDFDDAIFHNYDQHPSRWIRTLFGKRIDRLMSHASGITAGNVYLTDRAQKAGAVNIELIPTVVDLSRYTVSSTKLSQAENCPRVVWIGSPSTVKYLSLISKALMFLAASTQFKLRVIGGTITIPGVDVECLQWTEQSEAHLIAECDVGIMPLLDSNWEQGKCGYKLIQYMALGLPVIASPIGVNKKIITDGVNGFLAYEEIDWVQQLKSLIEDPSLQRKMGLIGRARVEELYSINSVAPRMIDFLKKTAEHQTES